VNHDSSLHHRCDKMKIWDTSLHVCYPCVGVVRYNGQFFKSISSFFSFCKLESVNEYITHYFQKKVNLEGLNFSVKSVE
jgi:hypothetical protein